MMIGCKLSWRSWAALSEIGLECRYSLLCLNLKKVIPFLLSLTYLDWFQLLEFVLLQFAHWPIQRENIDCVHSGAIWAGETKVWLSHIEFSVHVLLSSFEEIMKPQVQYFLVQFMWSRPMQYFWSATAM
jgi:hypothetical protein